METYLEFEKSLAEIDGKAQELRALDDSNRDVSTESEATALEEKSSILMKELYSNLTPWNKCQVARHPSRPHSLDYINQLFTEFTTLSGDRSFADDKAIVGGLARFDDKSVIVIGHEKGHDTNSRIARNFGMARPEGYRKATRLMDIADRFGIPIITLVDTPGAYPGKGAEERGQAEAIARTIEKSINVKVPVISVIIGEGGSGGAIALASANRVIMLEHSIYTVISPEGCASILWKDSEKMREAADALRLTAQDLEKLRVVDEIVSEPIGGAQRNKLEVINNVGKTLKRAINSFEGVPSSKLLKQRRDKFLEIGNHFS
ncbi:MAG: acetyl-CoA carboxylase carboxyltransferase subunit alpha [Pseudomonadota bacterium]|nr:acetyl-CoA carboxylase carboxyltransferase subunit alpha [Pseudomonadota bacterium]